jgi:hypothetical protein
MMIIISLFGQLGLWASSQGCGTSKHTIIIHDGYEKERKMPVWPTWVVDVVSGVQDVETYNNII